MNFNKINLKNNKASTNKNNIQSSNENVALCVVEKLWNVLDIKSEK